MYHKFYTVNSLTKMARLSGFTSLYADVVDLWLPILFLVGGLMKSLKVNKEVRCRMHYYFARLPLTPFLEMFSGHILLTVRKTWP